MRDRLLAFVDWHRMVAHAAANPGWIVVADGPGGHAKWIVIMEYRP